LIHVRFFFEDSDRILLETEDPEEGVIGRDYPLGDGTLVELLDVRPGPIPGSEDRIVQRPGNGDLFPGVVHLGR